MTLKEAAALLGLAPATLRQQIRDGALRAKKIGPIWTVTPGEVERYRRDHRRHKKDGSS
jgi:excisionase family DNA binding protein